MTQQRLLCALAVMPAVLLAGVSVAVTVAQTLGGGLWPPDDVTLAEAAATGRGADVLSLVDRGENPNARGTVRPEVLDSAPHVLTPLEAAVTGRESEMVSLLLRIGVTVTETQVRDLRCIEQRVPSPDTRAVLDAFFPGPAPLECP